ncbi:hypothetical protein TNCV_3960691 [Trichonephila clavipes]|nr:hypothetical protein TNCV_3960691 [Trichonephila clavipes]
MADISSCRRKEPVNSQQVPLLINCVQHQGDKCRGLLWPYSFTKVAYSLSWTLHPFERGAIGPDFVFIDDNSRSHQTANVQQLLERDDVTQMDWTVFSSGLQ